MKLNDFVRVYDNVLPLSLCDILIDTFESSTHKEVVDKDFKPFFTQLNLTKHYTDWSESLIMSALKCFSQYALDLRDWAHFLKGNELAMEEFRIKRYNANTGEQFADHIDACNLESSKRYLSLLFYLNDDFSGGETVFHPGQFNQLEVKPKKGSVVVFPPTWQYPHAGLPLIEGTKYIMSTYMNFV